jgi:hypothetical protein
MSRIYPLVNRAELRRTWEEPLTLNQRVPGSSPGAPTKQIKDLTDIFLKSSAQKNVLGR